MANTNRNEPSILYQFICAAFCVIVVMSNIISAKMIKLPYFQDFSIPAGLITYPLTFLISDFVTEIFGAKKAKLMVYIALGMNLISFCIIQLALVLPSPFKEEQAAFQAVLGLSGLRIFSSLFAYVIAQLIDIQLYSLIRSWTGPRWLWLRNNGSVCISQLADTIIIDIVYLYWGLAMEFNEVLLIMLVSYIYKASFSIINTPIFYLSVFLAKMDWTFLNKKWKNLRTEAALKN